MDIKELRKKEDDAFYAGDIDECIRVNEEILRFKPNDTTAIHNIGACYLQLKQYERSIKYFLMVLDIDQYNVDARYMLSEAKRLANGGYNG